MPRVTYPGVYVEEIPVGVHPISGVSTGTAAFVDIFASGPINRAVLVRSFREFESAFGDQARPQSPSRHGIRLFFANGGKETWVVRIAPNARGGADAVSLVGRCSKHSGLYALDSVENFNILCLPRAAELRPGDMRRVYTAAAQYCTERRAFLLMDIGAAVNTPRAVLAWLKSNEVLRHSHAAVYFPRLQIVNLARRGAKLDIAPSGAIAGLYARVDAERGVWKAPAGVEARLRGVTGLACRVSETDINSLSTQGINCLRLLPKAGIVSWGAQTASHASESKYVNVRRFVLYLEASIARGTQWAVFESNNETLWAQICSIVTDFLFSKWKCGALQGNKPEEAFFVRCDHTTMTQNDLDDGRLVCLVGVALVKPAEFVVIRIGQWTADRKA